MAREGEDVMYDGVRWLQRHQRGDEKVSKGITQSVQAPERR